MHLPYDVKSCNAKKKTQIDFKKQNTKVINREQDQEMVLVSWSIIIFI